MVVAPSAWRPPARPAAWGQSQAIGTKLYRAHKRDGERASPPMTKAPSTALPARSDSLNDIDSSPERGVYTQMSGVEQVRVRRGFQGRRGAARIALVPPQQFGKHGILIDDLAARAQFQSAARCSHFRGRRDEQ